jgi:ankyrin repeat protein
MVRELLAHGAKVEAADDDIEGKTPLSIAIDKCHWEVVQELQAAINTTKKT